MRPGSWLRSSLDDEPGGESTSVSAQFQTNVNVDEAEFAVFVGDGDGSRSVLVLLEENDLRRDFKASDS